MPPSRTPACTVRSAAGICATEIAESTNISVAMSAWQSEMASGNEPLVRSPTAARIRPSA
eukprot:6197454-Pleurochrysis_carterae.AAC.1